MTVREFLRTKTKVHTLCAIYQDGYLVNIVYIDYEDLFEVGKYADYEIKETKDGVLPVKTNHFNGDIEVPVTEIHISCYKNGEQRNG